MSQTGSCSFQAVNKGVREWARARSCGFCKSDEFILQLLARTLNS